MIPATGQRSAQSASLIRCGPTAANDFVLTRTPLRISFAGGGTDLPAFFDREYGAVFSTAINKYVYVTVKRHSELFCEPIRINYSKTEQTERICDIENNIVRACLEMLEIEPPIYISTVADVPASSGLGGSSSFAVGLLNALHAFRGERVSAGQLAEEASNIEIEVLQEPVGKQDQYAAAFGGMNFLRFERDGTVAVEPQRFACGSLHNLFDYIMMFWTGMQRNSSLVLSEQKSNTANRFETLREMRDYALQLRELANSVALDPVMFGKVLHESWLLKRQLASRITNNDIDSWYQLAIEAGAEGGKLCGAGGGGFLLFLVRPENRAAVRNALSLREVSIKPEVHGSRVLMPMQ